LCTAARGNVVALGSVQLPLLFYGILITRRLLDVVLESVSIRSSYQLRDWRLETSVAI
jgi:hypothetical protein